MSLSGTSRRATVSAVQEVTKGGVIYNVTFGGALSSVDVPLLSADGAALTAAAGPGGPATATTADISLFNPLDGKAISKIVVDPFSDVVYDASGDAVPARNEVQQIRLINWPSGATFTLSFTWPDATGTVVTQTTAAITIDFNLTPAQNALNIQAALNALPTINILPGIVTASVTAASAFDPTVYNVTFGRNLANTNVPTLVATPGYPPANGTGVVMAALSEGGVANVNGTPGGAGIWRLQGGTWFNLTSVVSTNRHASRRRRLPPRRANPTASATGTATIPSTPGPDDDLPPVPADQRRGPTWPDLHRHLQHPKRP